MKGDTARGGEMPCKGIEFGCHVPRLCHARLL